MTPEPKYRNPIFQRMHKRMAATEKEFVEMEKKRQVYTWRLA